MRRMRIKLKTLFAIQWRRCRTLGWTHWLTDWRKVWLALGLLEQIAETAMETGYWANREAQK